MTNADPKPNLSRIQGRDPSMSSLLGDALCLDFVNTVEDRTGQEATDLLSSYSDLVRWAWHAWVIEEEQRDALLTSGATAPEENDNVFALAIELREAMYDIFAALIAETAPATSDLAVLQRAYIGGLAEAHLARDDDRFVWDWGVVAPRPDTMLWPIAQSAVELLTSSHLHRVKQCPGTDDCGWLFLDISKNGTRRWCSMDGCGSRAKMRRLYARRRSG